jgi:hypothetical protein
MQNRLSNEVVERQILLLPELFCRVADYIHSGLKIEYLLRSLSAASAIPLYRPTGVGTSIIAQASGLIAVGRYFEVQGYSLVGCVEMKILKHSSARL